jgi:hypothetical protein
MIQGVRQGSAKATGFSEDLFSCILVQGQDQFQMLPGSEESYIILIIDHNHRRRGPQQFEDAGSCSRIKFLSADPQQEPL